MKLGKFFGVGTGPGDPELATIKAAKVLAEADLVFSVVSAHVADSVSERVVRAFRKEGPIERLSFSMSRDGQKRQAVTRANADAILAALREGKDCAFATIGDPLTYSTFGYMLSILKKEEPGLEVEIVPGVTSYSALTAKAKGVLVENDETLSVIPSFKAKDARSVEFKEGTSTVLLKTYHTKQALVGRLEKEEGVSFLYGENIGLEGEYLTTSLEEAKARPDCYLSLMVVRKERGPCKEG